MKILNTLLISLLAYSASAQVGIGTSTPDSPLDIEAVDAAIDINNSDSSDDPKINFQLTDVTTFSIGVDKCSKIVILLLISCSKSIILSCALISDKV